MSTSSPEIAESRLTTPGELCSAPGMLEPLPMDVTMAFFTFVGDSPSPLTDVFSRSFVKTYLDSSVPIRAVVETIGNVCMRYSQPGSLDSRRTAAAAVVAADRPRLHEFLDALTAPAFNDQHLTLLFGLLLAYAEAMVARSWLLYQSVIRKLSTKVQQHAKTRRHLPLLYFDRGLYLNFQLMASYHSLISFEDTFLVDVTLYDASPFADIDAHTSPIRANAAILHHYGTYVSCFARLHHRATKWVRQARDVVASRQSRGDATEDDLKQELESLGLLRSGREVIDGSASVIDVMELLRVRGGGGDDEDLDSSDFGYMREAFYHYALMGLTRTFWDPTWKLVDEDLPHMHDMPDLEAHGLFVLEKVEQRLPLLGLEAFGYLVILMGVALEVRRPEYQQRVHNVVKDIAEKGFACAETMLADMMMIWGMDYASQHDSGIGPSC